MPRYVAGCTFLFTEHALLDRPAAARAAGFDAIELWWPFATPSPAPAEVDTLVAAVEDAGVHLTGLTLFGGDLPGGDRGLLSVPGREDELRATVAVAADLAARLGVEGVTALYGNRVDGVAPDAQDALAQRNLRWVADALGAAGADVLLEPVSGAPRYPLRTAADVLAAVAAADLPNVRFLADLYHLATNGDDVGAVVAAHAGAFGHVQIADAPGRHEPGTGALGLEAHLAALDAAGYAGRVALEYHPSTDTEASLAWLKGATA